MTSEIVDEEILSTLSLEEGMWVGGAAARELTQSRRAAFAKAREHGQ